MERNKDEAGLAAGIRGEKSVKSIFKLQETSKVSRRHFFEKKFKKTKKIRRGGKNVLYTYKKYL